MPSTTDQPKPAMPIARVALNLPLDTLFDFLAPNLTKAAIGQLVIVPFGNKERVGVIIDIRVETDIPLAKLKPILHLQDHIPAFSANDLTLFEFCAGYYQHPLGQVILNTIPPDWRKPVVGKEARRYLSITPAGLDAIATLRAHAHAQRLILQTLAAQSPQTLDSLKTLHPSAGSVIANLLGKHWLTIAPRPSAAAHFVPGPVLNDEQQQVINNINSQQGHFAPFLLEGITGSGKTEVYLNLIAETLKQGKQALVLVPEINLSPALMRAVVRRFPQAAWVQLHSGLADGPRTAAYLEAQQGEADIIIGTRLAILAPIPRLGLIVVDEEHDPSYKQQEGLRYSARDVALYRARLVGCPIVLGSATPSLETLHNAFQQRITPLKLTRRAASDAGLPSVGFINLNHEAAPDGLTPSLIEAITETIKRGEQALLYINRRGYAPALVCNQCGWVPECRRCSARLVYHKRAASLKCHHCGYQAAPPPHCDDCGSPDLRPAGQGTERIEAALQQALPQARMARVDRDATSRRGSAERIFAATAAGEIDLLIGTQMISKGHDFPRLTLVGVINADGAVFSADFRASERLAAQMMQVAGRAGRAQLPGRVLIQTRFPEHPLYQAVAAQHYRQFADLLLQERQVAHLPPYSFLVLLRAEAKGLEPLQTFLTEATQQAQAAAAEYGINIWDPVPAPLARKAGYERWQLLLQADSRGAMQRFLRVWLPLLRAHKMPAVRWVMDVDPIEV